MIKGMRTADGKQKRNCKPDISKNVSGLDDVIANLMIWRPQLFPIRVNKTTVIYIKSRKKKV